MAVRFRQALKDTTDLIGICYDLRIGMRHTIVDEINLEQVFELLIKLRGIKEQLFEKSMPNAGIQLSSIKLYIVSQSHPTSYTARICRMRTSGHTTTFRTTTTP